MKLLVGLPKALSLSPEPNKGRSLACRLSAVKQLQWPGGQLRDLRFCSLNEFWSCLVNLHRTHIEKKVREKKEEKKHPDATLVRHHLRLRGAPYIDPYRVNCQSLWRSLGEEKDNRQGPVLVGCCRAIWPAGRLALV